MELTAQGNNWAGGSYLLFQALLQPTPFGDPQPNPSNLTLGATGVSDGWNHVVFTFKNKTANLYINTVAATAAPTNVFTALPSGFAGGGVIIAGSNIVGEVLDFLGSLDELALYHRDLTATEIKDHYNAGKP